MGVPVEQGQQVGGLAADVPASQPSPVPVQDADLGPAGADVPPQPNLKTCRNCGEKKLRTDFHRNHSKADELEDVCRPCKALRDANRRALRASVSPDYLLLFCCRWKQMLTTRCWFLY